VAYRVVDRNPTGHDRTVLVSKASLFFKHFDWIPIDDGEMIVVTFMQGAGSPGRALSSGEGKPVVNRSGPSGSSTRLLPRAIGKPKDRSRY
jgi:hypothetical protein